MGQRAAQRHFSSERIRRMNQWRARASMIGPSIAILVYSIIAIHCMGFVPGIDQTP
jgi:hypothetical protein